MSNQCTSDKTHFHRDSFRRIMAGRPWYAQGADLVHRLTVLGILGFSGYLCYGIGSAIHHNYQVKQRKLLLENQSEGTEVSEEKIEASR